MKKSFRCLSNNFFGLLLLVFSSLAMDEKDKHLYPKQLYAFEKFRTSSEMKKNELKETITFHTFDGTLKWSLPKEDVSKVSSYFYHLYSFNQISREKNYTIAISDVSRYVFDKNVSNVVAQALVAYFRNPHVRGICEEVVNLTTAHAIEMWLQTDRLGVAKLENFMGNRLIKLMSRDKNIFNKMSNCIVKNGRVDQDEIRKILTECFEGDTKLFSLWFERYCLCNPKYWDLNVPLYEITIKAAWAPKQIKVSSTGLFTAVEMKNGFYIKFDIHKYIDNNFSKATSITLEPGTSISLITFGPNDAYCLVEQQRESERSLQVYDCKNWQMIDFVKLNDFKTDFMGFEKGNIIILHDWHDKNVLQFYDFVARKIVRTCDISALDKFEEPVVLKNVICKANGSLILCFSESVWMNFNSEKDITLADEKKIDFFIDNFPRITGSSPMMMSQDGKCLMVMASMDGHPLQVWDIEKRLCVKKCTYLDQLSEYDEPSRFMLKQVSADGRYVAISFKAILPGTRGSGIMDNMVIFDCDSEKIVQKFSNVCAMDFALDMSFYVGVKRDKGWFSSKSKIMVHGVGGLQSMIENSFGEDVFYKTKKTSLFSFLTNK